MPPTVRNSLTTAITRFKAFKPDSDRGFRRGPGRSPWRGGLRGGEGAAELVGASCLPFFQPFSGAN